MLVIKPRWIKKSFFPITLFAMILIFIQGPLSFKADYCNMTNDSIYHVIDRFMAVFNLFFYVSKLTTYFWHARTSIFACQVVTIIGTILCFMKSQKAQIMQNPDDFCLWHSMWHMGPLVSTVIDSIEVFILEKRDSSNVCTRTRSLKESFISKESQFLLEDLMKSGVDENSDRYSNIKND